MMEKKTLRIILIGLLLIIITGCSESTPTGEMVYRNPGTGTYCQGHALCSADIFSNS